MRVRVYPYKMGSQGAARLCEALREAGIRALKVYPDRRYRPRMSDLIINWGSNRVPDWWSRAWERDLTRYQWLNTPGVVHNARNKLEAFNLLQAHGVPIPPWTAEIEEARSWVDQGRMVVARTTLTGSGGAGIVLCGPDDSIPHAPLYTQYVKKISEYRIHVFDQEVIDEQEKRRCRSVADVDNNIRTHSRGWVFCRDHVETPEMVKENARQAIQALGLDFGAVDVIWNRRAKRAYILEVNTAPGLEGSTVASYVRAIRRRLNAIQGSHPVRLPRSAT